MSTALVQIDGGPAFRCQPEDNVLRAALRSGVGFPYECSSGGCGSCQFELLEGEVEELWSEAPGLTLEARKARRHLACQSVVRSDARIKVRAKSHYVPVKVPVRRSARFMGRRALTADMAEYTFECSGMADFLPGQYALLRLPGVQGDRAYSMSNLPNPHGLWSFIIKRVPGGRSSGVIESTVREGDSIELDGPFGVAYFRSASQRNVVCIGGGSGLSPLKSILAAAAREPGLNGKSITLFYGGRTPSDLCVDRLLDEDERMKGRVQVVTAVSAPDTASNWAGKTGFIHEVLDEWLRGPDGVDPAGSEFYFCGPPPMTDAVHRSLLLGWKVPGAQLHFDRFV